MSTDKAGSGDLRTDAESNTPRVSQQTNHPSSLPARREEQRSNLWESRRQKIKPQNNETRIDEKKNQHPKHPRPTHFLALPLHTFPELQQRVSAFQNALFKETDIPILSGTVPPNSNANPNARVRKYIRMSTLVEGLDSSIVIDPRRLHMTLGVMSLEPDSNDAPSRPPGKEQVVGGDSTENQAEDQHDLNGAPLEGTAPASPINDIQLAAQLAPSSSGKGKERRTPGTALELLRSLQPQIKEILRGGTGVHVPLEVMDVLKTERMRPPRPTQTNADTGGSDISVPAGQGEVGTEPTQRSEVADREKKGVSDRKGGSKVGAGVLFLGPKHVPTSKISVERRKLTEVCNLVHGTFKHAGYITEQRPLKLHCTILNASHRKPMRRIPFCYSDVLALEDACKLISAAENIQDAINVAPEANNIAVPHVGETPTTSTSAAIRIPTVDKSMIRMALNDKPDSANSVRPAQQRAQHPQLVVPSPLSVNLGTYDVQSIELWVMGSRNENNEYVSIGGVSLC